MVCLYHPEAISKDLDRMLDDLVPIENLEGFRVQRDRDLRL